MASTNKCLAQSNKSSTGSKATKKRRSLPAARATGLARAQEHPAHGALHRAGAGQVQKLLARLGSRLALIVYDASFPGRITRLPPLSDRLSTSGLAGYVRWR